MLNVNPTNSSQIAQSVQRDYQQAAEAHRLAKASNQQTGNTVTKIGLTITTIVTAVALISQYIA